MKAKLCILVFVGLVAWSLAAVAQTPPAADPTAAPTPTTSVTVTNDTATPTAPTAEAPANNAPAVAQADPQPAPAPAPAPTPAAEAAPAQPVATPAAAPETSPAPPPTGGGRNNAIIPLIVMDDVPLTDAVRNLARQAGLNYMLDPKVAFGQAGPDGRPVAQPAVSIRWENVTAEQALTALLNNYNLQLVEDPKSKIARVTIKDPAAPDPLLTKVVQLRYATPTNIMVAIQNALVDKRSKVVADTRTSQLVVLATEKELAELDPLIERLDTATRQVLIEARMVETSMNPSTKKGFDWSGTLANQNFAFGNGVMDQTKSLSTTTMPGATTTTTPGGRTTTGSADSSVVTVLSSIIGNGGLGFNTLSGFTPGAGFLNADGVRAVFSFLNTYSEAKVISAPRTVTLDNETAHIAVTRASPIINVTAGTANTTGGSQILYTNLGVILDVTPRISANNLVNLKVVPEVSRVFDTITKTIAGQLFQADEYDVRKLETRVMIPSGNTLVMGGMVQDDVRNSNTKVPLLGDIPGIGLLFRSDTKSRQKSNLLVFITPTIVQDEDFQPTKTDFLRNPVPKTDSVEEDWSSWDSGKPRDWSKAKAAAKKSNFADVNTRPSTPASALTATTASAPDAAPASTAVPAPSNSSSPNFSPLNP